MSTAAVSTGFSQEAFDTFLSTRDDPAWLLDMRRTAWRKFQELPMPSVRDEEWMRTDIRLFKLDRFTLPDVQAANGQPHTADLPHALLAEGVELGGRGALLNGRVVAEELAENWTRDGVLFGSLDTLVCEHGDRLRRGF